MRVESNDSASLEMMTQLMVRLDKLEELIIQANGSKEEGTGTPVRLGDNNKAKSSSMFLMWIGRELC